MPTVWTIGYERLLPPQLVAELAAARVERVLDVRFRPQSRRPGMSKTRLGHLLEAHGIAYEHRRGARHPAGPAPRLPRGPDRAGAGGLPRVRRGQRGGGARPAGPRRRARAADRAAVPRGGSRRLPPAGALRGARRAAVRPGGRRPLVVQEEAGGVEHAPRAQPVEPRLRLGRRLPCRDGRRLPEAAQAVGLRARRSPGAARRGRRRSGAGARPRGRRATGHRRRGAPARREDG